MITQAYRRLLDVTAQPETQDALIGQHKIRQWLQYYYSTRAWHHPTQLIHSTLKSVG